jgi:uncharacterized LabA/DUF88 family protein
VEKMQADSVFSKPAAALGDGLIFVLIDGQNFRYKLPNWTNLDVDYFKLSRVFYEIGLENAVKEKMRIIYFDMFLVKKSAQEFATVEAKNGFINGLEDRGVKVETRDINCLPTKKNGKKDINMDRFIIQNLDLICDDPEVSHIILLSGDGDFYQYLRRAANNGKRVSVVAVRDSLNPKMINDEEIEVVYFESVKKVLTE